MKNEYSKCFLYGVLLFFMASCTSGDKTNSLPVKPVTKESVVRDSLELLHAIVKEGDLVTRLGDDFLSQQIKYMSQHDHSYSHVGVIVKKDNAVFVCHIYPDPNNADTIRYEPLDSFLNPLQNITCALYRYNFSPQEKAAFVTTLDSFSKLKIHFDKVYDLATNNKMYCSEMIDKALKQATHNRIAPAETHPPKNMVSLLLKYFAREKFTYKEVAERKFIAIDDLYLRPDCSKVISFSLNINNY